MPAILATIVLPVVTKGPGVFFGCSAPLARGPRAILAVGPPLHALTVCDDRALQDIGLNRLQIEAAVQGLITLSSQADAGMMTLPGRDELHARASAPTMEAAPWS